MNPCPAPPRGGAGGGGGGRRGGGGRGGGGGGGDQDRAARVRWGHNGVGGGALVVVAVHSV